MNTAQLLVKCLENEGVKYIFGIPGEEVLDIMQALRDSSIKFILVRHEQGAAFMADVYGRLTGKAGVCLSTLGPGATNLITGLADANCDGVPLVAITGQVPTDRLHITAHQFLDLNRLFSPITKRTKEILSPETVQEVVRLAFKYAEGDMPGATHITLPVDVARMPVAEGDVPLKHSFLELDERAEWGAIDQAAELIRQGKKTVVLAGNGVVRNHAGAALTRLADNAHLPVINTMMAKGVIRCDDSYSCSTVGLPFRDFGNLILSEADTIVAVGYDLVELDPSSWNKDCRTHIVHVATLPADVNKYYQADVQVVGSLSQSLDGIASLLSDYVSDSSWALEIRKMAQENDEEDKKDTSFPAKPQRIIADIRSVMSDDDILVSDVGANKVWVAREFPCYLPNTCLISNGFASMGFCLPGTIAAKLVYPERHVVGVTGDGGSPRLVHRDRHPSRRQLRVDQMERNGPLRIILLRRLRRSRFCCICREFRCERLPNHQNGRARTGVEGSVLSKRPFGDRLPCRLSGKSPFGGSYERDLRISEEKVAKVRFSVAKREYCS